MDEMTPLEVSKTLSLVAETDAAGALVSSILKKASVIIKDQQTQIDKLDSLLVESSDKPLFEEHFHKWTHIYNSQKMIRHYYKCDICGHVVWVNNRSSIEIDFK